MDVANEVEQLRQALRAEILKSKLAPRVELLMEAAKPFVILTSPSDVPPLTDAEVEEVVREQPGIKTTRIFQAVLTKRRLSAELALPLGVSRFGFVPDLPADLEWPTFEGKKYRFLAQIDFAVVPHWQGSLLPREGWLYVFAMFPEEQTADDPWRCAVLYHPASSAPLTRAQKPAEAEVWPLGTSEEPTEWLVPLFPRLGIDVDRTRLESDETDYAQLLYEFSDVRDSINALPDKDGFDRTTVGSLLGEIADVDGTAKSNIDDLTKSRVDAAAASFADGPEIPQGEWICLMEIHSSGSMEWSDAGSLYLIMRRSDLAARDFSRVCMSVCSA